MVGELRMHPDQEALNTLKQAAGFGRLRYFHVAGGVVALHEGFRLQ